MFGSGKHTSQILIISPEHWNGHFVSKHHYAVTLAKLGYDVYFLNPPCDVRGINIQQTDYANLWEVSAPQVAKGLRFYPKFLRNYAEKRWLEKLEKKIGKKFTTVWLFENSRFYDMAFAEDRLKIYHQMDSNQNFHVKKAVTSADISFCVTDFIKQTLLQYSRAVHKIHHGVEISSKYDCNSEGMEKFTIDGCHAVYVGNLDIPYLDSRLLYDLCRLHTDVIFHFVGTYSKNGQLFQQCKVLKNIIWWDKVPSDCIIPILKKADITLLCYKADEYREQLANSHKLMEYLASGKVTVATYTDEYKDKPGLLEMVDDAKAFLEKFDEVVADLEHYNSEEKQQKRIAFARAHSYEKQLTKIIDNLKRYNLEL